MAKPTSPLSMKSLLRSLLGWLFGFRAFNPEVLRTPGPVLLLPNHVSWLDWLFLLSCTEGDWKTVVSRRTAQTSWVHRLIMINRFTFPIDTDSPYGLKHMAEFLSKGGRLILFPEGRLSRTGSLLRLFEGTGFLLHRTKAKVVTCYLRGAERLPASPNPNRKQLRPVVSAHFSHLMTPPHVGHMNAARSRAFYTSWLRDKMVRQRFDTEMAFGPQTLTEGIIETARRLPGKVVLEDVVGTLTYRQLLERGEAAAEQLSEVLEVNNPRVGVLLPNIKAAPVVLLGLWLLEKEAALLNYSVGPASMVACIQLAKVRQIITSRVFLKQAKMDPAALTSMGLDLIFIEDFRAGTRGLSRFPVLRKGARILGAADADSRAGDRTAVILFTSGSEGVPKGVELTHGNILANVRQMIEVNDLVEVDRLFNAMPIFHSYGLSVGVLLPLLRGMYTFIYPSPLHYRVVPTVFYNADCTIMIGTNTFLKGYARRAHPYDFRSLRTMFAAAEKLQDATAAVWAQRFGVRVLEGYGATECSPCVSVNTPMEGKPGSAGRLLPGMEYHLEAVDGVAEGGRLLVRGPNVMKGYVKADTAAASPGLAEGWYDTGDIVRVDEEGYIFILGRLKRFAKISGEMVSLTAVEDALSGAFPQYGARCQVAVVSRPDGDRGERLIAVTNEAKVSMEDIRAALRVRNLPNIAVPRELKVVSEIPRLGTGKVNYKELEKHIELAASSLEAGTFAHKPEVTAAGI